METMTTAPPRRGWATLSLLALFAIGGSLAGCILAGCALAGCTGEYATPAGPRGRDGCEGNCSELPLPASRVPRLSHPQWENATRDLLQLPARSELSSGFLGDAASGVFDNDGNDLSVGSSLWGDYQRAAEALADQVTSDPEALARIAPPEGGSLDSRLRTMAQELGLRAYRRPPRAAEVDALTTIAADGLRFYPEMEPFAAGARVLLEALLQSPSFLYRVELSTGPDMPIELSSYEVASRLSFALWNSIPDEALLDAAARDALRDPEQVRAQAERMLADARARDMVGRFHHQWIDADRFLDISRSTELFPEYEPELPASMEQEALRFVDSVVFEDLGGFDDLLTAPYTVADARIARVYGVEAPSEEWGRITPADRAGLFTQIGFLAAQATSIESDPIHRGVHINRRVLCADLPAPPMMVPPLPDEDPTMPKTLRQRVEEHTGEGTCGERCHGGMINPIGFAYENYDALGRWRSQDNGFDVDASATYSFESGVRSYVGAMELGAIMSREEAAHRCYTGYWLEYLFGRRLGRADASLVRRVARASLEEDISVQEQILALVTSRPFLTRSTTELEYADPAEGM